MSQNRSQTSVFFQVSVEWYWMTNAKLHPHTSSWNPVYLFKRSVHNCPICSQSTIYLFTLAIMWYQGLIHWHLVISINRWNESYRYFRVCRAWSQRADSPQNLQEPQSLRTSIFPNHRGVSTGIPLPGYSYSNTCIRLVIPISAVRISLHPMLASQCHLSSCLGWSARRVRTK